MKEKLIIVAQELHNIFPKKIREEFGEFEHICSQHSEVLKVKSFTLDDLRFINCPQEFMRGLDFKSYVQKDHLALDIFCAKAIYSNKEILSDLRRLWFERHWCIGGNTSLETINFFGTTVSRGEEDCEHVISFDYRYSFNNSTDLPKFVPFENDEGWCTNEDYAVVFKKEFIEKISR